MELAAMCERCEAGHQQAMARLKRLSGGSSFEAFLRLF